MNSDLDLEQRYRRVLRLLPGYYREKWEEDMVAAFLDSWMTGDPDEDSVTMEFDRPSRREMASVAGLAARLYLGGVSAPRRYFAWGQAVRGTVLAVLLLQAILSIDQLVYLAWWRGLIGWLPAPPVILPAANNIWTVVWYAVYCTWIMIFIVLVLGHYRAAQAAAVLVIVPDLVAVLQAQLAGNLPSRFGPWAYWILLNLAPVLAMSAFHRDAPPVARRAWLLALPAGFLLVSVPLLAVQMTAHFAWMLDTPGQCCLLVALACLAHTPRARSSRPGTGVWSLTLTLTAALAGLYRIATLGDYLHDPHLVKVSLAELLILVAAAALVAPDAARTQAAIPAQPPFRRLVG
ncbi:MAG TPA: hypothetical protein VN969_04320 [Streptosporangiaceae bacterium]|nr:hypothetical protein [Streptosporangiaceae bacterium]